MNTEHPNYNVELPLHGVWRERWDEMREIWEIEDREERGIFEWEKREVRGERKNKYKNKKQY